MAYKNSINSPGQIEQDSKIKAEGELVKIISGLKKGKKKIVFTNGCFDIIHAGHVRLLKKAKSFGDILIVGLNTDASVRRYKGPARPIVSQDERSEIIAALESVDYVVLFDDPDPCRIISILKPDIHVKGGDYDPDNYIQMPESKVVREYGGEVKIINIHDGKSTTNIIKKILSERN
jgi:rfaE bifunctional protein nucleotidyltransferase chain/domain